LTEPIEPWLRRSEHYHSTALQALENGFADVAMSSLYYAVFNVAKAALLSRGINSKSHAATSNLVHREFARMPQFGPERAALYKDLFDRRQRADDGVHPVDMDTVESLLEPARDLMDRLRVLAAASGDA
jgi:uncharacterized protein (UPF0332 family)